MNLATLHEIEDFDKALLSVYRLGLHWENNQYNKQTDFVIEKMTKDWNESNAEWDDLYSAGEYLGSQPFVKGERGWISYDVTETIKEYIKNPNQNYGFMLSSNHVPTSTVTGHVSRFATSNNENAERRPKLEIYLKLQGINDKKPGSQSLQINSAGSGFISYETAKDIQGDIKVFSIAGELIYNSGKQNLKKGFNTLRFNKNLSTGVYIFSITAGKEQIAEKFAIFR